MSHRGFSIALDVADVLEAPTSVYVMVARVALPALEAFPREVRQLVFSCDGRRSFASLCQEHLMSPQNVARAIVKLCRLGALRPFDLQGAPKEVSAPHEISSAHSARRLVSNAQLSHAAEHVAFDHQDEAFFSSSIDHLLRPDERPQDWSWLNSLT